MSDFLLKRGSNQNHCKSAIYLIMIINYDCLYLKLSFIVFTEKLTSFIEKLTQEFSNSKYKYSIKTKTSKNSFAKPLLIGCDMCDQRFSCTTMLCPSIATLIQHVDDAQHQWRSQGLPGWWIAHPEDQNEEGSEENLKKNEDLQKNEERLGNVLILPTREQEAAFGPAQHNNMQRDLLNVFSLLNWFVIFIYNGLCSSEKNSNFAIMTVL